MSTHTLTTEQMIDRGIHTDTERLAWRTMLWYIRDGWNRECYTRRSPWRGLCHRLCGCLVKWL